MTEFYSDPETKVLNLYLLCWEWHKFAIHMFIFICKIFAHICLTLLNFVNTWRCQSSTFLTFDKRTRESTIASEIICEDRDINLFFAFLRSREWREFPFPGIPVGINLIFSRSTLRNHFLFLVLVSKHEIDRKVFPFLSQKWDFH